METEVAKKCVEDKFHDTLSKYFSVKCKEGTARNLICMLEYKKNLKRKDAMFITFDHTKKDDFPYIEAVIAHTTRKLIAKALR